MRPIGQVMKVECTRRSSERHLEALHGGCAPYCTIITAMGMVSQRLGFGATRYEPYHAARAFA
jgi:hypothetical protein